jgi:hypothetical protein
MHPFNESKLEIQANLSEEDWMWMETWPLFLRLGDGWAVVHGGCLPAVPLEGQGKNLVRIRYIDLETKKFKASQPGEQPDNTRYWAELWYGPESIFFGHAVYLNGPKQWSQRDLGVSDSKLVDCVGLDTGCVFGGKLSAAVLNGSSGFGVVTVQARRKYSDAPCDYDE